MNFSWRLALSPLLALGLSCGGNELTVPIVDAGGGGPVGPDASASTLKIIVEPSDKGAAIVDAIKTAKSSVHMTMYLLTSTAVTDALIAQHAAGHEVKVVLNQTFPSAGADNSLTFSRLTAAGVKVVWAPAAFNYTHEKCVVIDGTTAWIMTMNLTLTSPTDNREFLAVDTDPADVAEADAIFSADFAGTPAAVSGPLLVAPVNARAGLHGLVVGAKTTLDIEGESFSDKALETDVIAAKQRGVAVRVIVSDQAPSTAMAKTMADLKAAGVTVRKLAVPYIHSKAMVADGATAYVGSANLTQNSLDSNRELGLLTTDPAAVQVLADTISKDLAAGVAY